VLQINNTTPISYPHKVFATQPFLQHRGIRVTIPRRSNKRRRGKFDREVYRERNQVERTINRLKQYRRVATRYEKRAENYLAMLTIAAIFLWL